MKTPPLVASLNLQLKNVRPIVRLMSNIVLGLELQRLQVEHGYCGGAWWSHREATKAGERPLWGDFCKAQAGITEDSARNYIQCGEALKQRCKEVGGGVKGATAMFRMMSKQPSRLTDRERAHMVECMCSLFEGSTLISLREEFRARKTTAEDLQFVEGMPEKEAEACLKFRKMYRIGKVLSGSRNPSPEELEADKSMERLRSYMPPTGLHHARLALRAAASINRGTTPF